MPPKLSDTAPPAAGQPRAQTINETHQGGNVALSDDQFGRLVELLTPGYELSKLMLADRQAYEACKTEPAPSTETETPKG